MKGKWDILSNYVGGITLYQVYRLFDKQKVMASGNLDIDSTHGDQEDAQRRLYELNRAEGLQIWVASYMVREAEDKVMTFLTAVYAKRIREAADEALGFATKHHNKTEADVMITDIGIGDKNNSILFEKAKEDFLGEDTWSE